MSKILSQGQKSKLEHLGLNPNQKIMIEATAGVNTGSVDFACFGLNQSNKLQDDRYMIFYNQTSSPERAIQMNSSCFEVNLNQLPSFIERVSFVGSIDGTDSFKNIRNASFKLIDQNSQNTVQIDLNSSLFNQEKSVIICEIYKHNGEWRLGALLQGFNDGLSAILKYYGGEETTDSPLNFDEPQNNSNANQGGFSDPSFNHSSSRNSSQPPKVAYMNVKKVATISSGVIASALIAFLLIGAFLVNREIQKSSVKLTEFSLFPVCTLNSFDSLSKNFSHYLKLNLEGKYQEALNLLHEIDKTTDFASKRSGGTDPEYTNLKGLIILTAKHKGYTEFQGNDVELFEKALTQANIDLQKSCIKQNLALSYYNNDEIDKAKQVLEDILNQSPNHHRAKDMLGNIYVKKGDLVKAEELFKQGDNYINVAGIYAKQEKFEQLDQALDKALIKYDYIPDLWYMKALVNIKLKKWDEAQKNFDHLKSMTFDNKDKSVEMLEKYIKVRKSLF